VTRRLFDDAGFGNAGGRGGSTHAFGRLPKKPLSAPSLRAQQGTSPWPFWGGPAALNQVSSPITRQLIA
jgi:hypothetical protein